MNASISALRALTAIIFQRMLKPAIWIVLFVFFLLYAAVFYTSFSVSAWWFIALIGLVPLTIVVLSVLLALWHLSQRLMPRPLLPSESATLLEVVDKVQRLLEARATPIPIIMLIVAKDVARGKGSAYIENLVNDTKGLRGDFTRIKEMFEKKKLS